MAKENSKLRLIPLILVIAAIFATAVAGWVWQQAETKAIGKETATLGEEGCKPAKGHEVRVTLVEFRLDSIDKKMDDFAIEQKTSRQANETSFKEILERLPPKKPHP